MNIKERSKYWERCKDEANRILKTLEIDEPDCSFYVGLGWMPVVEDALKKMIAVGWDRDLHQVKQKFAGLCIYIGHNNDEIRNIIAEAKLQCYSLCEVCGKTRERKGIRTGWALCNACEKDET